VLTFELNDKTKDNFDGWTCSDATIAPAEEMTAEFKMPDKDITVTAKTSSKTEDKKLIVKELKYNNGSPLTQPIS